MLVTVVWDAVAAAVTGRRSRLPGLVAVLLGIGLLVLIGANAAAGQAPRSLPPASDSARVDDPTLPEGRTT
jgi:RND superfamily putative drug exporter